MGAPKILVFDSGLGGLTVYRELSSNLPDADFLYIADRAAFPYGDLHKDELVTRLLALFATLIAREKPDICVIACNTASTVALAPLREHFDLPFVGTVPAIKSAAEQSQSGLFSVLATPATVKRDYTRDLIEKFASNCQVTLVGAPNLAALAEQHIRRETVLAKELMREIGPAFVENEQGRTDCIVLGCTHFPLLTGLMKDHAPWPVRFIDPAPAIAKRTSAVLSQMTDQKGLLTGGRANDIRARRFIFTGPEDIVHPVIDFLHEIGLDDVVHDEIIG